MSTSGVCDLLTNRLALSLPAHSVCLDSVKRFHGKLWARMNRSSKEGPASTASSKIMKKWTNLGTNPYLVMARNKAEEWPTC